MTGMTIRGVDPSNVTSLCARPTRNSSKSVVAVLGPPRATEISAARAFVVPARSCLRGLRICGTALRCWRWSWCAVRTADELQPAVRSTFRWSFSPIVDGVVSRTIIPDPEGTDGVDAEDSTSRRNPAPPRRDAHRGCIEQKVARCSRRGRSRPTAVVLGFRQQ